MVTTMPRPRLASTIFAPRSGVLEALPQAVGREPRVAAVSCPDCGGSLTVSVLTNSLFFQCRIGHRYGLTELLAAKEEGLEARLWTAVTALEELTALLKDLHGRSRAPRARTEYMRRAEEFSTLTEALRRLIDRGEPLDLSVVEEAALAPESLES